MSKYKCFELKVDNNVANLVLSRPDELNTMTRDFWVELPEVLDEINRNSEIRAVILSSSGKHFVGYVLCGFLWLLPLYSVAVIYETICFLGPS